MQPPAWIDITAGDDERARGFYGGLFGWDIDVRPDLGYGVVAPGPGRLPVGIGRADPEAHRPAGVVVYFTVDDLEATVDRALHLGASIETPAWTVPTLGTMVVLLDPQGCRIGLWRPATDDVDAPTPVGDAR